MRFEVYCDESHPDLFASRKPPARFMVIGSLWLPTDSRHKIKTAIHALRDFGDDRRIRHGVRGSRNPRAWAAKNDR